MGGGYNREEVEVRSDMKNLFGLILVLGVIVFLGGAACGDDDDDGGNEGGSDPTATEVASEDGGDDSGDDSGDDGGEDADPEVEEYFAAVADIGERTNSELDAVNERMSSAVYDSEAEEVAANLEAFDEVGLTLETSAVAMGDLEAPESVSAEHDRFTQALFDYTQSVAELSEELQDVTTIDELNAVINAASADVNAVIDEVTESCLALEERGVEEIGDVDLACPGDA